MAACQSVKNWEPAGQLNLWQSNMLHQKIPHNVVSTLFDSADLYREDFRLAKLSVRLLVPPHFHPAIMSTSHIHLHWIFSSHHSLPPPASHPAVTSPGSETAGRTPGAPAPPAVAGGLTRLTTAPGAAEAGPGRPADPTGLMSTRPYRTTINWILLDSWTILIRG
jgi:hypothetical protein